MFDTAATIYYWARLGIVVIVVLLSVITAIRRSRSKAAKHDLWIGVLGLMAAVVVAVLGGGAASGLGILAACALVSLLVGAVLAKLRPLCAFVSSLCIVFAVAMMLFGEPAAESVGLYALAVAFGLPAGQGVRRLITGGKDAPEASPASAPTPVVEAEGA